jgi:hypothetical protein
MAVVESENTLTAVVGTEHTVFTVATGYKTRTFNVDVSGLASTEVVELRVYGPTRAGGTEQLVRGPITFTGVVTEPGTQGLPFLLQVGGRFTIKQASGTARTFPWTVNTLD